MDQQLLHIRQLLQSQHAQEALDLLKTLENKGLEEEQEEKAYLLGWAYLLTREWEEARHALSILLPPSLEHFDGEEMLLEEERSCLALFRLGRAAVSREAFEDAATHLPQFLEAARSPRVKRLSIQKFEARCFLGYALLHLGLPKKALQYFNDAERYDRGSVTTTWGADIHEYRAEAYRQLGSGDKFEEEVRKALALYKRVKGTEEKQAKLCLLLAGQRADAGVLAEALVLYEEAFKLASFKGIQYPSLVAQASIELSRLAKVQGDVTTALRYDIPARAYAERAAESDLQALAFVESATTNLLRAEASPLSHPHDQIRLLREAHWWLEKALALPLLERDFSALAGDVFHTLGRVLQALGQSDEALSAFEKAKSLQ